MFRIVATFIKEIQLLSKDKTGLTVLFAMPIILVVIMTLIQNEIYKSLNDSGIPVLLVNMDEDKLGDAIEQGFSESPICDLTIDHGEQFEDMRSVKEAVLHGKYLAALIIPKNATKILTEDVEGMLTVFIAEDSTAQEILKDIHFEIVVDPIAGKSFVMAITSGLKEMVATVKTKVMFEIMADKMAELSGIENKINFPETDFFVFEEVSAISSKERSYQPNAVQHNVPAWAIFSIFFIVLPLAGSIISERTTGIHIRMLTFPGSYLSILSGKIITYVLVAIVQFLIVLALGLCVLPMMGMPVLEIGDQWLALSILTRAVSVTAVGYGFLVGTLFDTPQQSAIFGGISVLIMSALGGIWVPINIMPESMQTIANLSPLNWALKGYYELFIQGGGWQEISFQVLKLCLFFIFSIVLSFYFYKLKRRLD